MLVTRPVLPFASAHVSNGYAVRELVGKNVRSVVCPQFRSVLHAQIPFSLSTVYQIIFSVPPLTP